MLRLNPYAIVSDKDDLITILLVYPDFDDWKLLVPSILGSVVDQILNYFTQADSVAKNGGKI